MDFNAACSYSLTVAERSLPQPEVELFYGNSLYTMSQAGLSKNRCWEMWRWNLGWEMFMRDQHWNEREGGRLRERLGPLSSRTRLSARPLNHCFTQSVKRHSINLGSLLLRWTLKEQTAQVLSHSRATSPSVKEIWAHLFQPHIACRVFGQTCEARLWASSSYNYGYPLANY